jgi:hypothetical protein
VKGLFTQIRMGRARPLGLGWRGRHELLRVLALEWPGRC